MVTVPSSHACSVVGMTVWAVSTFPQWEQWLPSVRPVSVQVGATAASVTGVWVLGSPSMLANVSTGHLEFKSLALRLLLALTNAGTWEHS